MRQVQYHSALQMKVGHNEVSSNALLRNVSVWVVFTCLNFTIIKTLNYPYKMCILCYQWQYTQM